MSAIPLQRSSGCHGATAATSPVAVGGKATGILRRIHMAMFQAGQSEANRRMAHLLRQSGGRLTDDLERRMEEELARNGSLHG